MRARLLIALVVGFGFVCSGMGGVRAAHAECAKPGKYKVKIDSLPQGAAVYIGDRSCPPVGVTPYSGTLAAGTFTVILEAPGFEAATRPFKVGKLRTEQSLFMQLSRRPTVEIRSDADRNLVGATVSIDGQPQGAIQGPMTIQTTAGRHLIEIRKEGFEPLSQWVDLSTTPALALTPTLKEIAKAKYGTIVVEADVQDAEVYIDGNKHPDNTPTVIANVVEGVHVIEVKKAPGPPWRQTVNVTANQQTKVRAELAPLLNAGVGVVRVLSDAPGARAFIDGTDMGPVPVDIKDVKAGEHLLQVKAPGFQTGEKPVTIAAGGSQIMKFDLNVEVATDVGTLKVVSSVPDAEVYIDGALAGKVPQEKKIAAGDHPITVRLEGYKAFEQKVTIEVGKTVTVQAELKAVGRLKVISTPAGASVLVNGVPAHDEGGNDKTPLTLDADAGETVVRIELPGFMPYQETVNIEGGKPALVNPQLVIAGRSDSEKLEEQKGLSSFGAKALPRGRSTVDVDIGYPYYVNGRITVGAGNIAHKLAFDATVGLRTMGSRSELGLGGRATVADYYPFSAGLFTNFWYGSALFDNSARNGLTFEVGALASLTALSNVTITGRAYLQTWSDRHCPTLQSDNTFKETSPTDTCSKYLEYFKSGTAPAGFDPQAVEGITGEKGKAFFGRENGARFMLSVVAEISLRQQWSAFLMVEGAPLQNERALYTNAFNGAMFKSDALIYGRLGLTYKF